MHMKALEVKIWNKVSLQFDQNQSCEEERLLMDNTTSLLLSQARLLTNHQINIGIYILFIL